MPNQEEAIQKILQSHPKASQVLVKSQDGQLVAYFVPLLRQAPTVMGLPRYRLPNNMFIVAPNKREALSQYQEFFVEREWLRHVSVHDGDCVLDIGANIGLFTLAAQNWNTTVFACEPGPDSFQTLFANTWLYGHHVQLSNTGVGEVEGVADFAYYPWSPAGSGYHGAQAREEFSRMAQQRAEAILKSLPAGSGRDERLVAERYLQQLSKKSFECELISTPTKTVSSIIKEYEIVIVHLLKIDVEGYEYRVLNGISDRDWSKIKQVMLEVHHKNTLNHCEILLRAKGYELTTQETVARGSGTYQVYAVRGDEIVQTSALELPSGLVSQENSVVVSSELEDFLSEQGIDALAKIVVTEQLEPFSSKGDELNNRVTSTFSKIEEELKQIVIGALGVSEIGLDQDILEVGGSLATLLRVVTQIDKKLGVLLPLEFVYRGPYTIREMTKTIFGKP